LFNQIFIVSKNFFASYFGTGAISSLNYAGYLPVNISSFIFAVVFSVLLTKLSASFATEKKSDTKKLFFNTLLGLLFVLIPVSAFFILFKFELLKLIFLRGNFDIDGINKILIPFFWESLSMITFILFIVPTSLYLAKKKYFLMSKIGSIIYIFGVLLNFILVRYIDFYGVAISQFVVGFLYGFFLLYFARKFLGRFGIYFWHLFMLFVSGIITLIICFFCKEYSVSFFNLDSIAGSVLFLTVNILLLAVIYLAVSKVFKVNYLEKIIRIYFSKS
jgi:putative peptidoglycan lipid II flippase